LIISNIFNGQLFALVVIKNFKYLVIHEKKLLTVRSFQASVIRRIDKVYGKIASLESFHKPLYNAAEKHLSCYSFGSCLERTNQDGKEWSSALFKIWFI